MLSPLTVREIALFAERHSVPVAHAHTLPVIFENIAKKANQPLRSIISRATYSNLELANYVKEIAEKVA